MKVKYAQFATYLFLVVTCSTGEAATPDFFLNPLRLNSVEEWENQTDKIEMWKKHRFLCTRGGRRSLNPHCYEYVRLSGGDPLSETLPARWEEKCEEDLRELSWEDFVNVPWRKLPERCQGAWKERKEEWIYKFSKDG